MVQISDREKSIVHAVKSLVGYLPAVAKIPVLSNEFPVFSIKLSVFQKVTLG